MDTSHAIPNRSDERPIAVLGGTGAQGGATARALLRAGASVRALVRDPSSARSQVLAQAGAEVVHADLSDVDSLQAALDGAQAVFAVTTFDGPGGTDEEVAQGERTGAAAHATGVRIVYTSVGGAERDTGVPHFESKRTVEKHLAGLGLADLTVIRPTFFMDNFLENGPVVEDGEVVFRSPMPAGVPVQMIAAADIGAVAAAALLDPAAVPDAVEIAGDELTPERVAVVYGQHHKLPARFEALPLSVLDDTPDIQAMFAWFSRRPAYQADFDATRRLVPAVMNLPTWLTRRP